MNKALIDHYRFPPELIGFKPLGELSSEPGYFRLGSDTVCYGRSAPPVAGQTKPGMGVDGMQYLKVENGTCRLPFDPTELVENLRWERYSRDPNGNRSDPHLTPILRNAYYFARPILPLILRRRLQRLALRKWKRILFPSWPIDRTVESIFEKLIHEALKVRNLEPLPFIWFWPEGRSACVILTHDVETAVGRDFCGELMEIDGSVGMKASFELVPEKRYAISPAFLERIRQCGFEVNVHDLNHDGRLFSSRGTFLDRSIKINRYVREFHAKGFRAGALYRNLDWLSELEIQYDMSVPNVAHLEPQRGGCCTVMPYFVGSIVELPLTMAQDYGVFHSLGDYSIDIWVRQLNLVLQKHGLASFSVHPDYVKARRAREVYVELLSYLTKLQDAIRLWTPLPCEVNDWWRLRHGMRLRFSDGRWRIEGLGSTRARVAYALVKDGRVEYQMEDH